jgi:hypothetical protein
MNEEPVTGAERGAASSGRASGIVLLAGSAVMIGFMALHPTVNHHAPSGLAAEMSRVAFRNALVHGALIANQGLILLGLLGLADRLGPRRMLVRAGVIAAAIGSIALPGAAVLNGFVSPGFIAASAGGKVPSDELHAGLLLAHLASVTLVRIGVPALCAAVLAWSAVLLRRGGPGRAIGALGAACGLGPIIAQATGHLPVDVHGLGAFVVAQSIWYVATAVQLIRGRM